MAIYSSSQEHLTQVLRVKLQTISHYQSLIASVTPTIVTLTGALNSQSEAILQLLHVHRMAPAWGATLVEIVRRKEYVRVFLLKAKEMADILKQFRTGELRRRDTFKAEIFRYIPAGLINGLDDLPPYCEFSISNTKDTLPGLNLDDISTFGKLVGTIRDIQISGDPSSDSGSISKLQAAMLKMTPQLSHILMDFEKLVAKSGLYERGKLLEEEIKRLKSLVPSTSGATINVKIPNDSPDLRGDQSSVSASSYARKEETLKAYETKIKHLERVLQERYHSSPDEVIEATLEKERGEAELQKTKILQLIEENDKLSLQLHSEKEKRLDAEKKAEALEQELLLAQQSEKKFVELEKETLEVHSGLI